MADDEYDYLERQLDAQQTPAVALPPPPPLQPTAPAPAAGPAGEDDSRDRRERRDRDERKSDKHRSRSRDRERSSRRDKEHSRERSRGGDRERERSDRDRDRDRERRERDDRGHRGGGGGGGGYERPRRAKTPPEVLAMREQEKELRELEKSTRTVFAYNVSLKADERDCFEFFSKAGRVLDVKLICDKNTKRSKGFAYIEYETQAFVLNAVALTGQLFMGQPLMVKSSEHEKNLAWEAQQTAKLNQASAAALLAAGGGAAPALLPGGTLGGYIGLGGALPGPPVASGPCKLSIGNLNPAIGEPELQGLFIPFGAVDFVQVVRDASGRPTGDGVVQFASMADASKAMQHWNGTTVAGQPLRVTLDSLAPAPGLLPGMYGGLAPLLPMPGGSVSSGFGPAMLPGPPGAEGGLGYVNGGGLIMPTAAAATAAAGIGSLDEEEEKGGLKLTSDKRQALMSRLATSAGMAPPAPLVFPTAPAPAAQPAGPRVDPNLLLMQGMLGPSSPIPTPCILIKNMFSPAEESGENWDIEIGEDVKEECAKYGPVVHVHVDKNSQGFVYLKFASVEGAAAAQHALHGRFFAGRQIACDFQFVHPYNAAFRLQ